MLTLNMNDVIENPLDHEIFYNERRLECKPVSFSVLTLTFGDEIPCR